MNVLPMRSICLPMWNARMAAQQQVTHTRRIASARACPSYQRDRVDIMCTMRTHLSRPISSPTSAGLAFDHLFVASHCTCDVFLLVMPSTFGGGYPPPNPAPRRGVPTLGVRRAGGLCANTSLHWSAVATSATTLSPPPGRENNFLL